MKVKIKSYHAIALWKWNLNPTDKQGYQGGGGDGDEAGDEEDDVCGICRVAFDGCCPECRVPGDDCPLIWGACSHVFHMHCLYKWINTESSKQACPMDRRPWVTAEQTFEPTVVAAPPEHIPTYEPYVRPGLEQTGTR